MFQINGLDHIAITVQDIEESQKWYQEVMGMEHRFVGMWEGVPVMLFHGTGGLALFPAKTGATNPESKRNLIMIQHVAFNVSGLDFAAAQVHLKSHNITFRFQDHIISHSIYFQDPNGHEIEITTYEL